MLATTAARPTDHHVTRSVMPNMVSPLLCKAFQVVLYPVVSASDTGLELPMQAIAYHSVACCRSHLCSCFEGRGISASAPKYFQSVAGSSPCKAGEGVAVDMFATALLQANGQQDLFTTCGIITHALLAQKRAAVTGGPLFVPKASR